MSSTPCPDARRTLRPSPGILILTLIITSLSIVSPLHAADWSGTVENRDGVSYVLNPSTPMEPALTIPLREQWRRGESDAEEVIFALLDDVAVADDGTVYALDSQLSAVQVFTPDGEYVRTIGREGEGPGEFTFPRSIFITPDGLIGVVQSMPGKIVLLTPEGDAAGNYPLPDTDGMFTIQEAREAGGRVFLYMRTTKASDNNQFFYDTERIVRLTPDGTIDAGMGQWERETDFTRLVFDEKKLTPVSAWDGARDGTMYIAGHFDDYRIDVWSPQGTQVRTIERDYELRRRSDEERERRGPLIRVATGEGELKTTTIKSETDRAIMEVFPRENGSLWVMSSRGAYNTPDGELCVLDEFDAAGRFVRELHIMGEGDLDRDAMEIIGNRVYVLTDRRSARYASMAQDSGDDGDEAAPMTLICYEIDGGLSVKK